MARQRNEGEGNKTAAREFNQAQERFVKDGRWQDAAKDAARAVDGPEGAELQRAEETARKPADKDRPAHGGNAAPSRDTTTPSSKRG